MLDDIMEWVCVGKMAPLWPAIGILVELFVLALIIIIYEIYKKKTTKKSADDQPA